MQDDEQIDRLWTVITEPRDRAWFALMLRAGLRVGEVVGLTLSDLLADRPDRGNRTRAFAIFPC